MSSLKSSDGPVSVAELKRHALFGDLFGGVGEEQLVRLAQDTDRVSLDVGEVLFRQGDVSDSLWFITTGCLELRVRGADGREAAVAHPATGEAIGEQGLLTSGLRSATALAVKPSTLLRFRKSTVERISDPTNPLLSFVNARFHHELIRRALARMFGELDAAVFEKIERDSESVALTRGQVLFREGDFSDGIYIVLSGRLAVVRVNAEGVQTILNEMSPGESIGEIAMLTGRPRAAGVHALRDADLLRISKDRFEALMLERPLAFRRFTNQVVLQLVAVERNASRAVPVRSIALVALHPSVKLSELAGRLAAEMVAHGSTLHLGSTKVDQLLGSDGIAHAGKDYVGVSRIRVWLQEQENQHQFILYEADPTATGWTERCIRQANHVVLVADAREDPSLRPIEEMLQSDEEVVTSQKLSLVLVHGEGVSQPSGTQAWLAKRHLNSHRHLRWNDAAHLARLARFLADRPVGVVLSGGGARGFAHVGGLQALAEAGIPVDLIGGTSAGAFVSAQYALGFPLDRIKSEIARVYRGSMGFTLPLVSLTSGRKYIQKLKTCLGQVQVEDLWIPYFCVSSDMSRCDMMVHREGELWKCALASGNLPGLLPPVVHEGRLLFDGMFFNDLPVDVMRDICGKEGKIIAIDVSAPDDLKQTEPFGDGLSGWRVLWSRLNPFTPTITLPGIVSILQRAAEMSSISRRKRLLASYTDLYLRMPVERFDILDFGAGDKIYEVGYAYARERLARRSAE